MMRVTTGSGLAVRVLRWPPHQQQQQQVEAEEKAEDRGRRASVSGMGIRQVICRATSRPAA